MTDLVAAQPGDLSAEAREAIDAFYKQPTGRQFQAGLMHAARRLMAGGMSLDEALDHVVEVVASASDSADAAGVQGDIKVYMSGLWTPLD